MSDSRDRSAQYDQLKETFVATLTELWKSQPSVSEICKSCGINRQQFAKYMNGQTLPSMFTLQRIASFFKVDVAVFFNQDRKSAEEILSIVHFDKNIFYDGYYLEVAESDAFENHIVVGLNRISLRDGKIFYKRKLPVQLAGSPKKRFWTYEGRGYQSFDCSFIFYVNRSLRENFGTYLVQPLYPGENDLFGVKAAISTPLPTPFASTILFHYLGPTINVRHYLNNVCGVPSLDSADPEILNLYNQVMSQTVLRTSIVKRTETG